MIRAEFLSGFHLRDASGAALEVPVAKARALFAYLALNSGRTHRRAFVGDLLWDAPSDRHARQSLRRCLWDLRAALGPAGDGVLLVDDTQIGIAPDAVEVDVLAFRHLVSNGDCIAAAGMLGGQELLTGLEIDVEPYDDWLRQERHCHAEMIADVCLAAAERLVTLGRLDKARTLAERCLRCDPHCEEAHRLLIELYFQSGRPDLARRQTDRMKQDTGTGADAPLSGGREAGPPARRSHWPGIHFEPVEMLGPDPVSPAIAGGLLDDLAREVAQHRLATLLLDAGSSHYSVRGSVRRSGPNFRTTLRLTDVERGAVIWSEAFDGSTTNLIEEQQRISAVAASRIMTQVAASEARLSKDDRLDAGSAYAIWQRGRQHCLRFTRQDNDIAKRLCLDAIAADGEFAAAYITLSKAETMDALFGYGGDRQQCLERAVASARTAIAIDPSIPGAHVALSNALARLTDFDGAVIASETAAALCPSYSDAHYASLVACYYAGRPQEAVHAALEAIRLDPMSPEIWTRYQMLARSFFDLGQHKNALHYAHKASISPNAKQVTLALKAAAAQKLGATGQARLAARELMQRDPGFTADYVVRHLGNERIHGNVCEFADLLSRTGVPR
jgi:DNA-binding SARP family transcriptional activator/Flp pilus assembly protein TadD